LKTIELLKSLGFREDAQTVGFGGCLFFDFGNLQISAVQGMNRRFVDVINLIGETSSRRSCMFIEQELPIEFESFEQGVAWITWCLDGGGIDKFEPLKPVNWLETGRKNFNLLPWLREQGPPKSCSLFDQ
jgi:hypothetical protein